MNTNAVVCPEPKDLVLMRIALPYIAPGIFIPYVWTVSVAIVQTKATGLIGVAFLCLFYPLVRSAPRSVRTNVVEPRSCTNTDANLDASTTGDWKHSWTGKIKCEQKQP
eukprot:COSAG02_NODE_6031_length_3858_cov_269.090982_3_plen_109_part_00